MVNISMLWQLYDAGGDMEELCNPCGHRVACVQHSASHSQPPSDD